MRSTRVAGIGMIVAVGTLLATGASVLLGLTVPESAPVAAPATAGSGPRAVYPVEADYCYIDGMIPHHDQALVLSAIVLQAQGVSDRTRALAEFIVADQTAEIAQMRSWTDAWARAVPEAQSEASGHAGHGAAPAPGEIATGCGHAGHTAMRGMASEAQLEGFRAVAGAAAERRFLDLMIVHHEGALEMATTAVTEGSNAYVRSSAKHVLVEQAREVQTMRAILATVP
jgi:uncharacterized protein (DUF305 family)